MPGRMLGWLASGVALLFCISPLARAQADVPNKAQVMQQIRMLYYTPTTAGLQSVSCSVAVDWHGVIQDASAGKPVSDTDPRLLYLNKIKISFTASLDGTSDIEWLAPSTDYPGGAAAMAQMESGIKKMLAGYFQTWAGFLNGTIFPQPAGDYHLVPVSDGFRMTLVQGTTSIDATLASDYKLKDYHVKTSAFDVDMIPSFEKTPKGLIFTGYEADYRTGSSVPAHVSLTSQDQQVSGYYLPSTFHMAVLNVGQFDFTFKDCTVNGNLPAASVPAGVQ